MCLAAIWCKIRGCLQAGGGPTGTELAAELNDLVSCLRVIKTTELTADFAGIAWCSGNTLRALYDPCYPIPLLIRNPFKLAKFGF